MTSFSANVIPGEPGYPAALEAALGGRSRPLQVLGALPTTELAVAIVGSRRATAEGMTLAEALAGQLAQRGVIIVSGGALGIDTAAHRGALAAGGRTVAVLGTGLDVVYPERNRALFQQIAERGALVSMFAAGTPPRGGNFVARNALIAGLSRAVVVVEAAERSGSLSTARFALDQGRVVCAVPGSPGANHLIGRGAARVFSVDDVLAALSGTPPAEAPPQATALDEVCAQVLAAIPPASAERGAEIDEDVLIEAVNLPPRAVIRALASLELLGLVMTAPGRRHRRTTSIPSALAEPIARGSRGQYPN